MQRRQLGKKEMVDSLNSVRQLDDDLVLCAVGDVFVDSEEPGSAFASTTAIFQTADIVCGNSEGVYARRFSKTPTAVHRIISDPKNALSLSEAGFDVMTCANNHILDGGYEGLAETLDVLRSQGIATVGVGSDIDEARRPAIVTRKGRTVAFLAYASVFPYGYEARENVPGLAPLRVHTMYTSPIPNFWNPGSNPIAITMPHPPDLDDFKNSIAQAKEQTDLVVVSCHWGDSAKPHIVSDYERRLAHEAIRAGADAVMGHHHHSLRGVEIYEGKPIFYGLGAFVFHMDIEHHDIPESVLQMLRERFGGSRPDYPKFPLHPECRMTAVAVVRFGRNGVSRVGLIPCYIQPNGRTDPFPPRSDLGAKTIDHLRGITAEERLDTVYVPEDEYSMAGVEVVGIHQRANVQG